MHHNHNLNRLVHFVAIVEEKTITGAARRLGLSKAVVSKHLQLLEQEVGVNLLIRNTRRLYPSKAGEAFYLRSKAVLIQAEQAFESLSAETAEPAGQVRITAPTDYGIHRLAPQLRAFSEAWPKIEIELDLNDARIDLLEQRFDLAFRVGWLHDSSNLARKLGDFREIFVAEARTARRWQVSRPEQLSSLPFIAFSGFDESRRTLTRQGKQRTINLTATLSINVTSAMHEAVRSGNCFAVLPDYSLEQDLADGRLVELLPDWQLRTGGIYLVSSPSRLRPRAVSLLIDELTNKLGERSPRA